MRLSFLPLPHSPKRKQVSNGKHPLPFRCDSAAQLEAALHKGYMHLAQVMRHEAPTLPAHEEDLRERATFSLSLFSATVYRLNLAHLITRHFAQHYGWDIELSTRVTTCLHEAVVNALVHGNLGIAHEFDHFIAFEKHYAELETKLRERPYRTRRIGVFMEHERESVSFSVSDEGSGYRPGEKMKSLQLKPYGRGLDIIAMMADGVSLQSEGRVMKMNFRL